MKKFKSIISMLLLISVLIVPAVFNGFADPEIDGPDGAPASTSGWNATYGEKTPGKTYTVTATTATGINKSFVIDTTGMNNYVKVTSVDKHARLGDNSGQEFPMVTVQYLHQGYATAKNPLPDIQSVIIPDGTTDVFHLHASSATPVEFIVIPKSIKHIRTAIQDNIIVLYEGSETDWNKILLPSGKYGRSNIRNDIKTAADAGRICFNCNYYDVAAGKATAKPASTAETPAVSAVSGFTDVKSTDYCAEPVKWAVKQGITTGVTKTTFVPGDTCTQAQIITFIWRSEGSPEPSGTAPYNISPDKYYYKAANWAYGKGMIDDYFNPNGGCSRAMAMTYLYKLAGSPAVSHSGNTFWDVSQSDSAYDAIYWAVDAGITKGTTVDTFSPAKTCTRGQIVTFLHRALVG